MRLFYLLCVLSLALGDVYLHNPRGSNDKINEAQNNRQNERRLFDSQNNANGGYNVGDDCVPPCSDAANNYDRNREGAGKGIMYYYVGSLLQIEWTAQHGCNNDNTHCQVILQYMCDPLREAEDETERPLIRDGKLTGTIPLEANATYNYDYGMHESYDYYINCTKRERNKGLFLADQFNNGEQISRVTAVFTRQDKAGTRYGYECPEERDYYPYWHPSPWKDIAVITDDLSMCSYYRTESQNVKKKGKCTLPQYNNKQMCQGNGGDWTSHKHGIAAPACRLAQRTRDNHLGDTADGGMANFNWTIPDDVSEACVVRIRYNISTADYPGWGSGAANAQDNNDVSPIKSTPYKDWIGLGEGISGPLRLSINSDQLGRTFQDRSHVFKIKRRPRSIDMGTKIYNLNVRGRRGNIQQVYPSLEYDFVPNRLTLKEGEFVHFQWTGSDSNPNGNQGEGRQMTDRSNLVETGSLNKNFPKTAYSGGIFDGSKDQIGNYAFMGQVGCDNATKDENNIANCALLNNASAYFDGGLVKMKNVGTFSYMSTRNHQFSNRSQRGIIVVVPFLPAWAIALIVIGSVGVLGAASVFGVRKATAYMALHPESKLAASKFGKVIQRTNKIIPFAAPVAYASQEDEKEPKPPGKFAEFWSREKYRIIFMFGYTICNIGFFFYGFILNLDGPTLYFSMAKGGGSLLNFNCSLILFPVLRNMISWLRLTPLSDVVPLDDNINFHKVVALFIFGGGLIHIVGHYLNYQVAFMNTGVTIAQNGFRTYYGVTGHLLLFLMFFLYITAATPIARKTFKLGKYKIGGYDVFWHTHHLYIPIFFLLWIHGPRFFMWSFYPIMLFLVEKFIRTYRGKEKTQVVKVIQHASDVLCIQMRKRDFHYKAGQYLYLNCPEISKTEWHPFTITSAPEEELFSVHIRCRGDWTSALRKILNPENKETVEFAPPTKAPVEVSSKGEDASTSVKLHISHPILKTDGPYGSASEHVFNHETVMLIGAGIGVTPFASIMKSISIRHKRAFGGPTSGVPKKVYFYWICGDEQEFNWFKFLLKDIESDPALQPIISLNTFMTGEVNLQEIMNNKERPVNMKYAGRPNWRRIFKEHQKNHEKQEIGIFFCGPIPLAQDIGRTAATFSSMQGTRFTFRKENF